MTLPAALAAFGERRAWILWRLVTLPDGKITKHPISPYTGWKHDPTDTTHHVSYGEALAVSQHYKCDGLAYVFTPGCGQFFIDIDGCREGNGWSALAHEIIAALPGAACEVSQSGNGLHLFGSYSGPEPQHSCKNKLGLECYTSGRFAAITGTYAMGDVRTDCTAQLPAVIARWFPPGADAGEAGDEKWEDRADPLWSGPSSDEELVALMLNSKPSVGQVLGGRASPRELWVADAHALGSSFPDSYNQPPRTWDFSAADAALAQHLAFWTGRNTERCRRLMWQSALRRQKWQDHKSYLWRTITRACGLQKDVYKGKRHGVDAPPAIPPTGGSVAPPLAIAAPKPDGSTEPARAIEVTAGMQWVTTAQQPQFFEGCVYVRDLHRAFVNNGGLLKPETFRAYFGGYSFSMDHNNDRTSRNAWECFTESQAIRFPKVETVCFRPELTSGTIVHEEGRKLVNIYVPIDTPRKTGDPAPFLTHMAKLLPDAGDHAIMMAYLAALLQYPGKKFQWCPLIQGAEGNGKTLLTRCISFAIGQRYTHLPNARSLGESGSNFNAWISQKLFIGIEEISFRDRADIFDALRILITGERIEIQGKGQDQITGDNRANFLMNCNGKEDIAVGIDKRRYAIFYTPQQSEEDVIRDGMGGNYFPDLYRWLYADGYAVVNDYLRSYAIPDELNPATTLMRAPKTSSTAEMIELSLGPIEQEIMEAVHEGRQGFANGWISSLAFDKLLATSTRGKSLPHRRRRAMLESLGYQWHPHLQEGRVNNFIPSENGKPRLYIKRGNPAISLRGGSDIVEAYLQAQGAMGSIMPPGTVGPGSRAGMH